ncbi:hypothetical protein MTP99_011559 [Tenebrio molitor]|nr:hypothetical protein MTP99_011559 [Tenebrio molitor]
MTCQSAKTSPNRRLLFVIPFEPPLSPHPPVPPLARTLSPWTPTTSPSRLFPLSKQSKNANVLSEVSQEIEMASDEPSLSRISAITPGTRSRPSLGGSWTHETSSTSVPRHVQVG